ncbi:MAG: DUF3616 domain-containing protein [Pseudomonadota bacterium]|nr:DUF3616 domain-containing protein [Pseudomonadota bacterium]
MKHNIQIALVILATPLLTLPVTSQTCAEVTEYSGMCDASAAIAVRPEMFVVANDEDNTLRVYKHDKPSEPVHTVDLTSFLKLDPKHPEADIEGATRIGDRIYWITSHGTNKEGKPRPSRHRLFATEVKVADDKVPSPPSVLLTKNWSKTLPKPQG